VLKWYYLSGKRQVLKRFLTIREEADPEVLLSFRKEADAPEKGQMLKCQGKEAGANSPIVVREEADDEVLLPVRCQERGESAEVVLTSGKRQALMWYREEESTEVLLAVRKEAGC
jgi:hypothetical protein